MTDFAQLRHHHDAWGSGMALGVVVILVMLAGSGTAPVPRSAAVFSEDRGNTVSGTNVADGTFLKVANLQPLNRLNRDTPSLRLDGRFQSHDPSQFAGVRALRFDRGRYRPSPIDAKLELHMTGESTSVGIGGAVSRLLRQAAK